MLSEAEFRFGESVTQELAYESLLVKERRALHGRIARLLEEATGEAPAERSALLAHHYARSEDRRKAIDALLRAAADAERVPSYQATREFYRAAWMMSVAALDGSADEALQRAWSTSRRATWTRSSASPAAGATSPRPRATARRPPRSPRTRASR